MASRRIEELFDWLGEEVIVFDGFDEALVGWTRPMNSPTLAVYDFDTMVDIIVSRDGCDMDEAIEFIDFNVVGGYFGPGTPVVLYRPDWVDVRFKQDV